MPWDREKGREEEWVKTGEGEEEGLEAPEISIERWRWWRGQRPWDKHLWEEEVFVLTDGDAEGVEEVNRR